MNQTVPCPDNISDLGYPFRDFVVEFLGSTNSLADGDQQALHDELRTSLGFEIGFRES